MILFTGNEHHASMTTERSWFEQCKLFSFFFYFAWPVPWAACIKQLSHCFSCALKKVALFLATPQATITLNAPFTNNKCISNVTDGA